MSEEFFNDNAADINAMKMPCHTKRIGRELAMLYLFISEMNESTLSKTREKVFEEAAGIMHWQASRELRKGQEYAESLLDVWSLHQPEIDDKICNLSANWEWDRLSSVDRQIMRVAACEMMFVPEVPPVVSINEAVEIANDYSGENSGNFINGVLNAIKNQLSRPAREAVDHL